MVGNESGFYSLGKNDLFFLLCMFICFQPILVVRHEDQRLEFILEYTDKEFLEE